MDQLPVEQDQQKWNNEHQTVEQNTGSGIQKDQEKAEQDQQAMEQDKQTVVQDQQAVEEDQLAVEQNLRTAVIGAGSASS